jgi:tetratricopeptide (TPR) repeat protein
MALSLFAPDASRSGLTRVSGLGNNVKRLDEAVKRLARLHFLKPAGARLTVAGLTRELAKARLSKDNQPEEFLKRFVACFLAYTKGHSKSTPEDYDSLQAEQDNILQAMNVAFDLEDWESVQTIARIICPPSKGVLTVRGFWSEALRCEDQALDAARRNKDEWAIAEFAGNSATLRFLRGEYAEARKAHQDSLEAFKKLGSDENVAVALHQLAMLALEHGEFDEARRLYQESLGIAMKLGDQSSIAITLHELGRLALEQDELDDARRLYEQSLQIKQELGDQSEIATTLHELGRLTRFQGDLEESRRLCHESLEIKKRLGDQSGIATTLQVLALMSEDEGNLDEATQMFRQALAIFERLRSPYAEIVRGDLERVEGKSS